VDFHQVELEMIGAAMILKFSVGLMAALGVALALGVLNAIANSTGQDSEEASAASDIVSGSEDCADRKATIDHMKAQWAKLEPYVLDCDLTSLPAGEREAVEMLVSASLCMDVAFLGQVYEWNFCIREELARSSAPGTELYQEYYEIMFGPWDRLDGDKAFLEADPKPPGANFYPLSLTEAEWEAHLKAHPEDREAFTGGFTMIRRKNGALVAVPYSEYFRDQLGPCAARLEKAAEATSDLSLKRYLKSRAKALLSDDYFESDLLWLDLGGPIEVVLGPYEVYEDTRFGYKTAFQAQVGLVNREESLQLERISGLMTAMEANLPVPEKYRNFQRGEAAPIKVIDQIFAAGDAKAGVLTAAFNLPNDERVRARKGSKKVLLKNVMAAKFEACALPIAEAVLSKKDLQHVEFKPFFHFILMHEVSHALGPDDVCAAEDAAAGAKTTVRHALRDLYAPLEECKADTLSLYNIAFLVGQGVLDGSLDSLYATYLADLFRTLRFGSDSAHGAAAAMELAHVVITSVIYQGHPALSQS